jgi:hypothetical protein
MVLNEVDFRISINHLYDLLLKLNLHIQNNKDMKTQLLLRNIFEIMQDINEHYYKEDLKSIKVADDKKDIH